MCPNSTGRPCGACPVCRGVEALDWVDLLPVTPVGASSIIRRGAIAGSSDRKDDDPPVPVREFFRTAAVNARQKVVIIDECDRMNGDAANALLKTLEEPLPHARMILITDSIGRVLPTILSRCVCIACAQPESDSKGSTIELFAKGAPRLVADMQKNEPFYEEIAHTFASIASSGRYSGLAASERVRALGEKFADVNKLPSRKANAEILRCWALWFRAHRPQDVSAPAYIAEAHRKILANANPGIVMDNLCLRILADLPG